MDSRERLAGDLDRLLGQLSKARQRFLVALDDEVVPKKDRDQIVARLSGAEVDLRRAIAAASGTKDEYDEILEKARKRQRRDSIADYSLLESLGTYA